MVDVRRCLNSLWYSDIFRIQALQTQKRHREYEMFRIHGTRLVQAGSRLHRTVSRKVFFVNREVWDFFVVPLVPCTTTSPALGLTKYASAYEIRRQRGQARRGGIGEMRDLHFSSSSVSPTSVFLSCVSCVSRRFLPALEYFLHPFIQETISSRRSDCGGWREIPNSPPHLC